MKNILTILYLLLFLQGFALNTTYYVSNTGSDLANGLTTGTAWKTISKVNSSSFGAGDQILFNRGDTWRETLTVPSSGVNGNHLTFGAYGTGAKPKILGSTLLTVWTATGTTNVWMSTSTVSNPGSVPGPGHAYFKETIGDSVSWGRVKKAAISNLAVEYDWTFNSSDSRIYIYSPSNPNTRYAGLEVSQREVCLSLANKNYITIDGIEFAYAASQGIKDVYPTSALTGLTIQNNLVHHIGTKNSPNGYGIASWHSNALYKNNIVHDCGRRNFALDAYASSTTVSNVVAEYNYCYNGFHTTGFDCIASDNTSLTNFTIRYNVIEDNATQSLDHIESYPGNGIFIAAQGAGTVTNFLIHNNVFKYGTGNGVHCQNSTGVQIYNNTFYGVSNACNVSGQVWIEGTAGVSPQATGVNTMKNNIFYNNVLCASNIHYNLVYVPSSITLTANYNLFFTTISTIKMLNVPTQYTMAQWGTYKSASGREANSPNPANPLFVSSTDYHLQSGSPAINAGQDVGFGDDIGAFPYSSGVTTPTITWGPLTAITYGTAISGTQLSASTGIPGTYAYSISGSPLVAGAILGAGTYSIDVLFTPTDNVTYSTATKTVTLVVNKATATLTYSNLTKAYTGSPLSPDITTSPAGLTVVNTTYNGVSTVPTGPGTWTVISGLSNANYTASTITATFTITGAPPVTSVITWSNPAAITYPTPLSSTQNNATTNGVGTLTYTFVNGTVLGAGTHTLRVDFTPTDPTAYTSATKTVTIVVNKKTETLSFSNLTQTYTGAALSPTVTTSPDAGVTVINITLNGVSGGQINAGSYSAIAGLTSSNYVATPISATFTINKRTVVINASNQTVNYDGLTHSITATTTPSVTGLTYTYNGSPTAPSAIGSYDVAINVVSANNQASEVHVTLTIQSNPAIIFISDTTKVYNGSPQSVTVTSAYSYTLTGSPQTNAGSYSVTATINDGIHTGSASATMTIAKKAAVLTWTQPASMPYGSLLSATHLSATSNISGSWSYNHVIGEQLQIGSTTVTGTFTPTDPSNYSGGSVFVIINVFAVTPFLDFFISGNGQYFFQEQ